ncbi:MAG: threonine ammonia-lyase [Alphaproteobacteria bacterium]|nr:MAG: threonine ammonia-lyase [Alphaproteobacteria bacterium]
MAEQQATDNPAAALPVSLADIRAAAGRLEGAIRRTACEKSQTLSAITGCTVYIKFENLQFTAAYKERGALNKLLSLSAAERKRGVVAMSAGNHAQGVAYHAQRLGIPATIVMPFGTPQIKIKHTAVLGAKVEVHGDKLEDATARALEIAEKEDRVFVHPFDDPIVIAGQGTVALEMLEDVPDLDVLCVPIGGGGLISGMAVAAKTLRPDIEIIGVQAEFYPSMHAALRGQEAVCGGDTLAEGIAVKFPGKVTTQIVRRLVDDILLVGEHTLESAVSMLVNIEKTVAEGAGAAGLAALLAYPERFRGRKVGLVITGGNIDSRLLSSILMRDLIREGRIVRLRLTMRDLPGQLMKAAQVVSSHGGNIIDVHHSRHFLNLPAKGTSCDMEVEARDSAQIKAIIDDLNEAGFRVQTLATSS